jgi:hypothetical protein
MPQLSEPQPRSFSKTPLFDRRRWVTIQPAPTPWDCPAPPKPRRGASAPPPLWAKPGAGFHSPISIGATLSAGPASRATLGSQRGTGDARRRPGSGSLVRRSPSAALRMSDVRLHLGGPADGAAASAMTRGAKGEVRNRPSSGSRGAVDQGSIATRDATIAAARGSNAP